ncbi:MAG: PQQ-dependent sugar dehydrogenase [Myxococcota bacterium]
MRLLGLIFATSLLAVLALGCADTPESSTDALETSSPLGVTAEAVGPFLDGVLPERSPTSPASAGWQTADAFPAVEFSGTVVIASNPAQDLLYVGSRDGVIQSFEVRDDVTSADPFLDLRDRVAVIFDGGLMGLVFHPDFGDDGSPYRNVFYVFYTSHCPLDDTRLAPDLTNCNDDYPREFTGGFFDTYLRLSRFELVDETTTADLDSERILINIQAFNASHRGGSMAFASDGYLYLTLGDQFRYETSQELVERLEGGILRIAVDIVDAGDGTWTCPGGSHLPRRSYDTATEISGQYYCIPDDNPWLDVDGGSFEEYCTLGHRNPYRLSYDAVSDRLWLGEVGEDKREEINIVECGNNYGWPFREGLIEGDNAPPEQIIGVLTDPVLDFTRDEARAVIGGYVYRGSKFPSLSGRYLVGDFLQRNIWAVTLDEATMTASKVFLTDFPPGGLATWGQDNQGELYLGSVTTTGPLYQLERIDDPIPDAPSRLSETGAFSDLDSLTVSDYWVPYGLNQPFWSDSADKARFVAIPNDGLRDSASERAVLSEGAPWEFPPGTVFMKHFSLGLDESDPTDSTRLETRFLVRGTDGNWYGLTYRWRADQRDADLLAEAQTADYEVALASGGSRTQTWNFPSRRQCLTCHQENAGGALGASVHQLNGDFVYEGSGTTGNQLVAWSNLGMLDVVLDDQSVQALAAAPALGDVSASLQDRARSWLDSNCGYCHRPGGANAGFDARFTTAFEEQNFVWTGVRDDLGIPGTVVIYPGDPVRSALWQRAEAVGVTAMPPLAKELPEDDAVDLLAEWISRIDNTIARSGVAYEYYEVEGLTQLPDFDSLTPRTAGFVDGFDISVRERGDGFAIRFQGFLWVEFSGDYTFYTTSDDGSQLFIDGALVVDNDGLHGAQERSGGVQLDAGYHEIVVTMFEGTVGQFLSVDWEGPATNDIKASIDGALLFANIPDDDPNDPPTLAALGSRQDRPGDTVRLMLEADDPDGDALYYDASGLPPGVTVDHQTGEISGTVDDEGAYQVLTSASDGPEVAVASFEWLVDDGVAGSGGAAGGSGGSGGPLGEPVEGGSGGCAVGGSSSSHGQPLALLVIAALLRRKRRRASVESSLASSSRNDL